MISLLVRSTPELLFAQQAQQSSPITIQQRTDMNKTLQY